MDRPPATRRAGSDAAAWTVLVFATLNLSHVFNEATDTRSLLWPLAAALAAVVLLRHGSWRATGGVFPWFAAFMLAYLGSATLTSLLTSEVEWILVASYSVTFLIVAAFHAWFMDMGEDEFVGFHGAFKGLLVVACLGTILLPLLGLDLGHAADRASGLFEDPNEASVVALFTMVLILAHPSRRLWVTLLQAGVALAALLLTYSKSGMLMLAVVVLLAAVRRRSVGLALLSLGGVGMVTLVLPAILASGQLDLVPEHRDRLAAVVAILSGGEINAETSTGRTLLWQLGLDRIAARFPLGAGLGEFHHLEGGYRNPHTHDWLGTHEFFLMVAGEGGLLSLALLLVTLGRLAVGALRTADFTALGLTVVLVGDMLSTHSQLSSRVANVALALAMVHVARSVRARYGRGQAPVVFRAAST
jgi:hypothetical protein